MSLTRKLSSRSAYRSAEDSTTRPRSSLGVRSESSDSATQDLKLQHRHNDYSCYIHVINKTESSLQLVDSKPISGHWANGTPPQNIASNTDTLIELTDPKGPQGSEGWCAYRLQHPERSTPITFKLKFSDPYWTGHDNYLKASTRHPGLVSLNVLRYQTSGHPFIAYIEVKTLRTKNASSPKVQKPADEVISESSSDDGTSSLESPSESLPGYESRPVTASDPVKEPILSLQPVNVGVDHDCTVDQKKSAIVITVTEDGDNFSHDNTDKTENSQELVTPNESTNTLSESQIEHGVTDKTQDEKESNDDLQNAAEEPPLERQKNSEESEEHTETPREEPLKQKEVDGEVDDGKSSHDLQADESGDLSIDHVEHTKQDLERSTDESIEDPNTEVDQQPSELDEKALIKEPEAVQESEPEPVPEPATEPVLEPVDEPTPEPILEPVQEPAPESQVVQEPARRLIEDNNETEQPFSHDTDTVPVIEEPAVKKTKEHDRQIDDSTWAPVPRSNPESEPQPKVIYDDKETQTDHGAHHHQSPSIRAPSENKDKESEVEPAAKVDNVVNNEQPQPKAVPVADADQKAPISQPPVHHHHNHHRHREAHVPTFMQVASSIWTDVTTTVFKTRHGQLGIIALVFLTSYGITAAKVSRGIMVGGAGRR